MTGCRLCATPLTETFVDLGMAPLCDAYLGAEALDTADTVYPLHVRICPQCLLVQLPPYRAGGATTSCPPQYGERLADAMVDLLELGPDSVVVSLPGSDGDVVAPFAARGVPATPTAAGPGAWRALA